MRVLVCGDRHWTDQGYIDDVLNRLHSEKAIEVVIEGEAPGADSCGANWAVRKGIKVEKFPADWSKYGRAAGPIRNTSMLTEGKPDLVIAFHDDISASKGTKNMILQATKADCKVVLVSHKTMVNHDNN